MNEFNSVPQGWQCPICKRVYAPFIPCCYHCGNEKIITTTTITTGTPPTQDVVTTSESAPVED